MSEYHLPNLEVEQPTKAEAKEQKWRADILKSLGDEFNVFRDALLELGDFTNLPDVFFNEDKTFNERKFLETAEKLNSTYLEHLKSLIKDEVAELGAISKKHLEANSAKTFITRLEFFSRLAPPEQLPIGGQTIEQLEAALAAANMQVSPYVRQMMGSPEVTLQKDTEKTDLVRLKVQDLGFTKNATTDEVYQKAKELGLQLCPAEVGPEYRLHYTNQPMNEWLAIAMETIPGLDGNPYVFDLEHGGDGVWLNNRWAGPTFRWGPEDGFVFRLRPLQVT